MGGTVAARACAALFLLAAGLAGGAAASSGLTSLDVLRAAEARGIRVDSNLVERTMATSLLLMIDPGARIVENGDLSAVTGAVSIASAEALPEGILYLRMSGIFPGAADELTNRLAAWHDDTRTGIIMDIRGAAGTDLDAVDAIAGIFAVSNAPLYTVKNAAGDILETRFTRRPDVNPLASKVPVMLLVDGDTRDASEILAAAMKDRCRVMILGSPTRGGHAVRELVPVSDTVAIYLATRWVAGAAGETFGAAGIEPDITIPTNFVPIVVSEKIARRNHGRPLSEKAELDIQLMERVQKDGALSRAADILLGLRALRRLPVDVSAQETPADVPAAAPEPEAPPAATPDAGVDEQVEK